MNQFLVALLMVFLCQAISAKSIADLKDALIDAEAIHSVVKDDRDSTHLNKINKVIDDLTEIQNSMEGLKPSEQLPRWASEIVDDSSEVIGMELMLCSLIGSEGKENFAKVKKYIEEHSH